MEGYRRVIYPEMLNAYNEFFRFGNWSVIERSRRAGYERFRSQRNAVMDLYHVSGGKDDFTRKIRELLQTT
jgi:hypothetical protein